MTPTIKINGKEYQLADLSKIAKEMLRNIEAAESRLRQLKQEAAMVTVAREVYGKTLIENLPREVRPGEAAAKTEH